jgi:hypothetical protein
MFHAQFIAASVPVCAARRIFLRCGSGTIVDCPLLHAGCTDPIR